MASGDGIYKAFMMIFVIASLAMGSIVGFLFWMANAGPIWSIVAGLAPLGAFLLWFFWNRFH